MLLLHQAVRNTNIQDMEFPFKYTSSPQTLISVRVFGFAMLQSVSLGL